MVAQIDLSNCFSKHPYMASSYASKLKIFKTFCWLWSVFQKRKLWKSTNDCCYHLTSSNLFTVKKIYGRCFRFQFNKIEKVWVQVEILCLDFPKTRSNQYIKSKRVATFKNYEIFSNLYFSYVRDCKATLSVGN